MMVKAHSKTKLGISRTIALNATSSINITQVSVEEPLQNDEDKVVTATGEA